MPEKSISSITEQLSGAPQKEPADYFYGSAYEDHYLLTNPASLPRFGHLARKALMHYAGDRYNPHLHGLTVEPFIREMIKEFISYQILYRTNAYDWDWIDNSLRKAIGGCLSINLPFDQSLLDRGFAAPAKANTLLDWNTCT